MIIRIVFSFIFFSTIYFFIVYDLKGKWFPHHNPWFDNAAIIESFLYSSPDTFDFVIAGSSLGIQLKKDIISDKVYNLSLAGLGPLQGLGYLRSSNKKTKSVLIELNRLFVTNNIDFEEYMSSLFNKAIKKNVVFARSKYQPIRYIGYLFMALIDKVKYEISLLVDFKKEKRNKNVDGIKPEKQTLKYDYGNVDDLLTLLEAQVDDLLKQEVEVFLFEIPNYKYNKRDKMSNLINKKALELSLKNKCYFIEYDKNRKYNTSDGAHLTETSAKQYSEYLKKELIKIRTNE